MGIVVICGLFEKEDSLGYPTGEKEFGVSIPDEEAQKISTVGDAITHVEALKK